jgi:hypothetical protein
VWLRRRPAGPGRMTGITGGLAAVAESGQRQPASTLAITPWDGHFIQRQRYRYQRLTLAFWPATLGGSRAMR